LKEHNPKRKESEVGEPNFYANHEDINFQFINPTTPANYFHALRRQIMRNYRKPLIVASPKILIRHPGAKSALEDLGGDSSFIPVYIYTKDGDITDKVTNLFVCTGKISYEINALFKENPDLHAKSALLVIEELLPFPEAILKEELNKFNKNAKVIWVQEEPYNSGAFAYSEPHLARIMDEVGFKNKNVICQARRSIASTATGVAEKHSKEHKALLKSLLQYK